METTQKESFWDTARENAESFNETFKKYPSVNRFLKRDDYVSVRGSSVTLKEQSELFKFVPDIDGCVIEWNDLSYINHSVRKLYLGPNDKASVKPINPLLRKHVTLSKESSESLRMCSGFQILYEAGWEYWIGFLPTDGNHTRYDASTLSQMTYSLMLELRRKLCENIKKLLEENLAINSVNKNNLSNLRSFTVLPDDQTLIMCVFQDSIDSLDIPPGLKKIIFSFRFGEKTQSGFEIPALSSRAIEEMTCHVGVNIIPPPLTDIMWSRSTIQQLVGRRGSMTACMSFYECGNFQSNLDGSPMDVSADLLQVSKSPNEVQFIQLYTDTPHQRPNVRSHSVSGSIAVNKAVNHVTRSSFSRDAMEYISVVRNNLATMRNFQCRLEFVTRTLSTQTHLKPLDFLDLDCLQHLLSCFPLVNPFYQGTLFSDSIASIVSNIGLHLACRLQAILDVYKSTGSCDATWNAYQIELALEKMLWGNPTSTYSYQCAVDLGVGHGNPSQCKSDSLGFLALEQWQRSAESPDITPPLKIWSTSGITQKQIKKVFGLHDIVDEASHVVGRKTMLILLEDFYDMDIRFGISFHEFLLFLKGERRIPSTTGAITLKQLAHQLSKSEGIKFPMVWGAVTEILRHHDLNAIIASGAKELNLLYFPAFRLYDMQRNPRLMWRANFQYLAISDTCTQGAPKATVLSELVIAEMERRKVAHSSYLRREVRLPFPWIMSCQRKLEDQHLSEETLVTVLTFVSCVALFQNDSYVSYYALRKLHEDLTMSQFQLKRLEILGKLPLSKFNLFRLHRLHQSIPFKLAKVNLLPTTTTRPQAERDQEVPFHTEEIPEEDACNKESVISITSRHLPSEWKFSWSSEELAVLEELKKESKLAPTKQSYIAYQKGCRSRTMPDRSFHSFRQKVTRLIKL